MSLYKLGFNLAPLGRHEESERAYKRALPVLKQAFGATSGRVADAWAGLAQNYGVAGRFDEAVFAQRRALASYEAAFGPNHSDVETAARLLGGHLLSLGRDYDEARGLLLRSIALRVTRTEHRLLDVQNLLNSLHLLLLIDLRKGDRSSIEVLETICEKVRRITEQEPNDLLSATVKQLTANLADLRGRRDIAISLYESSINSLEKTFGEHSAAVAVAHIKLSSLVRRNGDP